MSQRRIEGLSSASTDVGPSTTALLPPRTTPLAHRAASATLNSKDLRDDQYPPAKGVMGNAGTTAMLLSLALAVGNKLVGTVRGHWLRCQADRKKLKAQSRRIQRLERELREAKAAAQVVRVGGGGVDAAGGAAWVADSLRAQLVCAEEAVDKAEAQARREMLQQEEEKLDLEEAAEAAVEQMARANEFAEQVRVVAAARVAQLSAALTAAGVPVPEEEVPLQLSEGAKGGALEKSAYQAELEKARALMRQELASGTQDDTAR